MSPIGPVPGVRRAYVDTDVGQIHYRVAGASDAWPLVMLHQGPSSSAMWEPIMPLFAGRGWRVLAPDLLGHGASDGGHGSPSLADYAAGVWSWLDALGIGSMHLVGHHSGASIALLMATEQPERVHALAVWGVPLLPPHRLDGLASEGAPDWDRAHEWLGQRWERRRAASDPGFTAEIGRRAILELMQAGPNSNALHNAVGRAPLEDVLPRVAQPTLVLCGERDWLYAASEQAAALLPRGRFEPMPGTTLDVADQEPEWFVSIIDAFLAEVLVQR
jgi:pimeloyl-ACP methyl ester carboxylesterase